MRSMYCSSSSEINSVGWEFPDYMAISFEKYKCHTSKHPICCYNHGRVDSK